MSKGVQIVFYIFLAVLVVEGILLLRARSTQTKPSVPPPSQSQEYVKLIATPPADTTFHFGMVKTVDGIGDKVTLILELIKNPNTKLPAFTITDKTLMFKVKDNQQIATTSTALKVGQRVVLVSDKYNEETKAASVREIILNIPANGVYPARILK